MVNKWSSKKILGNILIMKCSECNKEFGCAIDEGKPLCWCMESKVKRIAIQDPKKNCLCQECLEKETKKPKKEGT